MPVSPWAISGAYRLVAGMNAPARRYSWPPFQPGNEVGLRHGIYSPRKVDPLAAELVEMAVAQATYLAEPSYALAIWAWARAEARVQLLEEYLADRGGVLNDKGEPVPATVLLDQCERRAGKLRNELGLTPLARARLGRDVAAQTVDLARLWADDVTGEAHQSPYDEQEDGT